MKYDIIIGTSTGALLSPMVALEKFDKLKEAYTSMNQNDIFDINPFCKDGSISPQNAIQRIIRGKSTLGETQKLRKKIEYDAYEKLSKAEKEKHIDVEPPSKKQNIVDDITMEALIDLHENVPHGRGSIKFWL